jgi:alpha-methylacyl-CoA racemase
MSQGPLAGRRIVEFGAIGPAPYCGMLADLGADVVRIEAPRPGGQAGGAVADTRFDVANQRAVRLT